MEKNIDMLKWELYKDRLKKITILGLKIGHISTYNDELIEKLRTIYDGGIPASIILLSNSLSNGHCYDRALLMARAFIDNSDEDVKLIYATIDGLRLNPNVKGKQSDEHCFLERTTKEGCKLIYDTSSGLIYDKNIYWIIEKPIVRKISSKESIRKYLMEEDKRYPEDIEEKKYYATFILPMIEMTYGNKNEMYSQKGIELLQREVEYYKKQIDYEQVCKEVKEDIKKLQLKNNDSII